MYEMAAHRPAFKAFVRFRLVLLLIAIYPGLHNLLII